MLWGMPGEWVTLREAARKSGVSVSAIRKWYGEKEIQVKSEKGPYGRQNLVRLDQVVARSQRRQDAVDARTAPSGPDAVSALSAAVLALAELSSKLIAAQDRCAAAERALEAVAGSKYAASVLIEGETR